MPSQCYDIRARKGPNIFSHRIKTNNNLKRREFFCLRENNEISAQLIFTGENINMDRRVGMERELAKRVLMHEEKGKEGVNKRTKPRHFFFLSFRL